MDGRIAARTHSIARQFDRVCETLIELGYLAGTTDNLRVTDQGRMLGVLYSESDLLIAECLRASVWSGLEPHELASVVAAIVYEARRSEGDVGPAVPGGAVETALTGVHRVWARLSEIERAHRLNPEPEPDAGLVWAARELILGLWLGTTHGMTWPWLRVPGSGLVAWIYVVWVWFDAWTHEGKALMEPCLSSRPVGYKCVYHAGLMQTEHLRLHVQCRCVSFSQTRTLGRCAADLREAVCKLPRGMLASLL